MTRTQPNDIFTIIGNIIGGLVGLFMRMNALQRLITFLVLYICWLVIHYFAWGSLEGVLKALFVGWQGSDLSHPAVLITEIGIAVTFVAMGGGYFWLRGQSTRRQIAQNERLAASAHLYKITIPKDNKTKWQTMATFYYAIRDALSTTTKEVWDGNGVHLSLELVGTDRDIACYVWLPDIADSRSIDLPKVIIEQLRAVYGDVHVSLVQDPLQQEGDLEGRFVWYEIGLAKPSFYPIGMEFKLDPLNNLLSSLVSDVAVKILGIQFVLRPANMTWTEDAQRYVQDTNASIAQMPVKANANDQRRIIKAIEEKKDALGYDVIVRVWGVARTPAGNPQLNQRLSGLSSVFSIYNGHNQWTRKQTSQDPTLVLQRGFVPHHTEGVLNCDEMAAMFHLAGNDINIQSVAYLKARSVAPTADIIVDPNARTNYRTFGQHDFGDGRPLVPVGITYGHAVRHGVGIGRTGTGKSTLIVNEVLGDIDAGHGVVVFDPHFDLITDILTRIPQHRIKDVVLLDPTDPYRTFGSNPLEVGASETPEFRAASMMSTFPVIMGASWETAVRMQNILSVAVNTLVGVSFDRRTSATLFDMRRMLTNRDMMESYARANRDPVLAEEWENYLALEDKEWRNIIQPALTRINRLIRNKYLRNIFAQPHTTIRWRELLDDRRIVLCNVSRRALGGADNSNVLTAILFQDIYNALMSRLEDMTEDERMELLCFIYVDESPDIVNPNAKQIEEMFSQMRKAGAGMNLYAQFMSQFSVSIQKAIVGNVYRTAFFQTGVEDAILASRMLGGGLTPNDITNVPQHHAYLKLGSNDPVLIKTFRKPDTLHDTPVIFRNKAEIQRAQAEGRIPERPALPNK